METKTMYLYCHYSRHSVANDNIEYMLMDKREDVFWKNRGHHYITTIDVPVMHDSQVNYIKELASSSAIKKAADKLKEAENGKF